MTVEFTLFCVIKFVSLMTSYKNFSRKSFSGVGSVFRIVVNVDDRNLKRFVTVPRTFGHPRDVVSSSVKNSDVKFSVLEIEVILYKDGVLSRSFVAPLYRTVCVGRFGFVSTRQFKSGWLELSWEN